MPRPAPGRKSSLPLTKSVKHGSPFNPSLNTLRQINSTLSHDLKDFAETYGEVWHQDKKTSEAFTNTIYGIINEFTEFHYKAMSTDNDDGQTAVIIGAGNLASEWDLIHTCAGSEADATDLRDLYNSLVDQFDNEYKSILLFSPVQISVEHLRGLHTKLGCGSLKRLQEAINNRGSGNRSNRTDDQRGRKTVTTSSSDPSGPSISEGNTPLRYPRLILGPAAYLPSSIKSEFRKTP